MSDDKPQRPKVTGEDRLPGDPDAKTLVERMIRVDQAGEYGAARIYEGQLAVLGNRPVGDTIRHMAEQEQKHLDAFDKLIVERHVRPTVLGPIWHAAGFALGAASAVQQRACFGMPITSKLYRMPTPNHGLDHDRQLPHRTEPGTRVGRPGKTARGLSSWSRGQW